MTREDALKYKKEYEKTHKPMPKNLKLTKDLADKINNFISEHIKDVLDSQKKREYEPYANFYLLGEDGYVSTMNETKLPLKEIVTHVSLNKGYNWDKIYTVLFNRYKVDNRTPILKLPIFSGIDKNGKALDWNLKRYLNPGEPDLRSYCYGETEIYEQGPGYIEEEDKSYYISNESVHFKEMIDHPYKNMYIGDLEDLSCFVDYITTNEKNLDNKSLIDEVLYGKNMDKCFLYDWKKEFDKGFIDHYKYLKRRLENQFEEKYTLGLSTKRIVDKTDLLTIAQGMPVLDLDYTLTNIKYISGENQDYVSTKIIWEENDLNKIHTDVYLNFVLDVNDEDELKVIPEIYIPKDEICSHAGSFEINVKEQEEHAFNEFSKSYGIDVREFANYLYDTYGEIRFDDIESDLEEFREVHEEKER